MPADLPMTEDDALMSALAFVMAHVVLFAIVSGCACAIDAWRNRDAR